MCECLYHFQSSVEMFKSTVFVQKFVCLFWMCLVFGDHRSTVVGVGCIFPEIYNVDDNKYLHSFERYNSKIKE